MRILVVGGTGTVGSHVVRELAARDADVCVLSRDAARTSRQPASVRIVEGNLLKPATVEQVFAGFDAVFLINAMSQTESTEGLMAVAGMRRAGVKRVVYVSVQDVETVAWLPHFGSKVGIETAIRNSGMAYTILRPNNFFQNDYWFRDAIVGAGIYPQPLGDIGVSRVDVRDVAEMAAIALVSPNGTHDGQTYDVVGPEVLNGPATAAAWTAALGREVRYMGNDLDAWEQQARGSMPDWFVFNARLMFEHFMKHGLAASDAAIARQTKVLGHPPRAFSTFAEEVAGTWSG